MKITKIGKVVKLAQGVPPGFIKVRVKIDKKGNFTREIIRDGQSTCQAGDDKLLSDPYRTKLPGFGSVGTVTDTGKTQEYYRQVAPQIPSEPQPEQEQEQEPFVPETPQRQLDTGFGV